MHSLPFSAPAKPRPNSPGIATAVSEIVEHLFVVLFHNTLLFLQKKKRAESTKRLKHSRKMQIYPLKKSALSLKSLIL
jgi:hypothetical protein